MIWQYLVKVLVTAVVVVVIAETAKRWTLFGAIVASLPLTSILAMIWLYMDTSSVEKVNALSQGIFFIVIPSLTFFLLFPVFTKYGFSFWFSLGASSLSTALVYWVYIQTLLKFKIINS